MHSEMNATLWATSTLKVHSSQVACHLCSAVIRIGRCFSQEEVPQVRQGLQWIKLQCQDAALLSEALAVVGYVMPSLPFDAVRWVDHTRLRSLYVAGVVLCEFRAISSACSQSANVG
jgi:hypothetical protein